MGLRLELDDLIVSTADARSTGDFVYSKFPPRNTGPIFADCPAITLAGLTPPCSFPCLAGASWRFH